jgi:hypothetical protein
LSAHSAFQATNPRPVDPCNTTLLDDR